MKKVYLVGFMGAGKSTVGPLLADALKVPHFDLDQEVEKRNGKSISQLISLHGESYFRDQESESLRELVFSEQGAVISLGGGTLLREVNRETLLGSGRQVYLKASLKTLAERTLRQHALRPLLPPESLEERVQRISNLFAVRQEHYEKADFNISTDSLTPEAICALIASQILKDGLNFGRMNTSLDSGVRTSA
jgi:shikimate kinase